MKLWPLVLLVFAPGRAPAQEAAALPLGVRVRISTANGEVVGTLARLRDDTVGVVPEGETLQLAVPLAELDALEVSRGRFRRTGRGAVIGLGTGLTLGVVTAVALCGDDRCESSGGEWTGVAVGLLGLGGAVTGLGLGALIGSFIRQEKWREVSITWIQAGVMPLPRGRLGLSLAVPVRFP